MTQTEDQINDTLEPFEESFPSSHKIHDRLEWNGHVLHVSRSTGAKLVFGSDGHAPGDYPLRVEAERIALGAGMTPEEVQQMFLNAEQVFRRAGRRKSSSRRGTRKR